MAMTINQFNQLKKLMMLTTSDNDQEALSALRKANAALSVHGYDWNAVFGRLVKVHDEIEAVEPERPKNNQDSIENAFIFLESRGYNSNFITSLNEQWHDKHWLSAAQQAALFRTVDTVRQKRT